MVQERKNYAGSETLPASIKKKEKVQGGHRKTPVCMFACAQEKGVGLARTTCIRCI